MITLFSNEELSTCTVTGRKVGKAQNPTEVTKPALNPTRVAFIIGTEFHFICFAEDACRT
jgi:hypothetical protein